MSPKPSLRLPFAPVAMTLIVILLVVPACAPPLVDPHIATSSPKVEGGEEQRVAAQTIPAEGGTLAVSVPGSLLDGLTLNVPDGAYDAQVDLDVSYSPIVRYRFAAGGEPAGPMIHIRGAETYADEVMELRIPVTAAADEVVIPFIYNENDDALEGLTIVEQDTESITVATCHFSSLVTVRYTRSQLQRLNLDTGFAPDVDGWQFANEGSYLEPQGHCSGMSLAAMWYFVEQRRNEQPPLWGRYESFSLGADTGTPGFTLDDDLGIKLCTMVQREIRPVTQMQFFEKLRSEGEPFQRDEKQFYAAVAAMLETNEPQYLTVARAGGANTHAIICFMILDNRLFVADPNRPGETKVLTYDYGSRKLSSFNSNDTSQKLGSEGETSYDRILFVGKTNLYRWSRIGTFFNQAYSGELNSQPYPFPDYDLRIDELDNEYNVVTASPVELALPGDHEVSHSRIQFAIEKPSGFEGKIEVYQFGTPPRKLSGTIIDIEEGDHLFGVHVVGKASWTEKSDSGADIPMEADRWAGFHWVRVRYSADEPDDGICSMQEVAGTWTFHWDSGCDGVTDYSDTPEDSPTLHADGAVSYPTDSTGYGYRWGIDDNGRIQLSFWTGGSAALSDGCSQMTDGAFVSYEPIVGTRHVTCFTASK